MMCTSIDILFLFSEPIHNPTLATFPSVVDQADLMDVIRVSMVCLLKSLSVGSVRV